MEFTDESPGHGRWHWRWLFAEEVLIAIGYVLLQPWTRDVMLGGQLWGDAEANQGRVEVFSCMVKAQRAAKRWQGRQVAVAPWELDSPLVELEAGAPEPPTPPLPSDPLTARSPTLFDGFCTT